MTATVLSDKQSYQFLEMIRVFSCIKQCLVLEKAVFWFPTRQKVPETCAKAAEVGMGRRELSRVAHLFRRLGVQVRTDKTKNLQL